MAIRLPSRVNLSSTRAARTAARGTAGPVLGASRQSLMNWRRRHGFPRSFNIGHGWFLDRVAVEQWLRARGVEIVT